MPESLYTLSLRVEGSPDCGHLPLGLLSKQKLGRTFLLDSTPRGNQLGGSWFPTLKTRDYESHLIKKGDLIDSQSTAGIHRIGVWIVFFLLYDDYCGYIGEITIVIGR